MSGLLSPKEPEKVDKPAEKAKLQRERLALQKRSAFNQNTLTSGGDGVTTEGKTFRSTLGG